MTQNERIILTLLVTQGALTKRQIEAHSGLAWATVSKLMTRLEDLEYVVREGLSPDNSGGKNAYLFNVSGSFPLSLGIDIEYQTTEMIIINLKDEILARTSFPTAPSTDEVSFFSALVGQIQEFVGTSGIPWAGIHGVGIGMPGWLFGQTAVDFPKMTDLVSVALAKPVTVVNNIRAYVASVLRRHDTPPHFMLLTIRTGISVGIVLNSQQFSGENDLAGSIGHIRFRPTRQIQCRCGEFGCLESYANYSALAQAAISALGLPDSDEPTAVHHLFDRAATGEARAHEVLHTFALDLAIGIASMIVALNIKTVYLASDFGPHGQLLGDELKIITTEKVLHTIEFSILYDQLVEERYLFGAAHLVLNSFCDFTKNGV